MWANKLCNCPIPGRGSVDRSPSEWPGIWWHRRGPRPPCSLSGKVNKKGQVGGARGNWRRVLGLRNWEQADVGRTQEPGAGLCQVTEFELWETLKGIYLNYVTNVACTEILCIFKAPNRPIKKCIPYTRRKTSGGPQQLKPNIVSSRPPYTHQVIQNKMQYYHEITVRKSKNLWVFFSYVDIFNALRNQVIFFSSFCCSVFVGALSRCLVCLLLMSPPWCKTTGIWVMMVRVFFFFLNFSVFWPLILQQKALALSPVNASMLFTCFKPVSHLISLRISKLPSAFLYLRRRGLQRLMLGSIITPKSSRWFC